jgi:hypothetical protein
MAQLTLLTLLLNVTNIVVGGLDVNTLISVNRSGATTGSIRRKRYRCGILY